MANNSDFFSRRWSCVSVHRTAQIRAACRRVRGVEFKAHTDSAICSLHTECVHTKARTRTWLRRSFIQARRKRKATTVVTGVPASRAKHSVTWTGVIKSSAQLMHSDSDKYTVRRWGQILLRGATFAHLCGQI